MMRFKVVLSIAGAIELAKSIAKRMPTIFNRTIVLLRRKISHKQLIFKLIFFYT